jgi:hypothetical protein
MYIVKIVAVQFTICEAINILRLCFISSIIIIIIIDKFGRAAVSLADHVYITFIAIVYVYSWTQFQATQFKKC